METPLPKLRSIETFPVDVDSKPLVFLRDPLRYAADPLLVPYPAYFIVTLLDGRRSAEDVRRAFTRQYGTPLDARELDAFVATLDEHHYLDSTRFDARRSTIDGEFRAAATRAPAHAGTSYPEEPAALRARVDGFYTDLARPVSATPLAGLVAPHIDLRLGGRAYGCAYAAVAAAPAARYVILGTSHAAGTRRFAVTRKDFTTPLGTVPTDRAFVDRLAATMSTDLFADEILHRTEHAIEFQVVMLQHALGARPFTIVPILVTSIHDLIARARAPGADHAIAELVAALRAALVSDDVPTVIIAGVDFAHVGRKFGDPAGLTPELLAATEAKDRRLLAALAAGDPDGFFAALAADADRTRVCGAAPLCVFLELMRGVPGRLLSYDGTRDDGTRSLVTFASLAFDHPA